MSQTLATPVPVDLSDSRVDCCEHGGLYVSVTNDAGTSLRFCRHHYGNQALALTRKGFLTPTYTPEDTDGR